MYSKAKIAGHPIHPMLIAFPITFYTTTFIAFMVYQFYSLDIFWFKLGYFCNYAGVFSALAAAVPGLIDWGFGIPKGSLAKSRGLTHMLLNIGALILFGINAIRLYGSWNDVPAGVANYTLFSFVGLVMTAGAGWLGWNLVSVDKVGIDEKSSNLYPGRL